MEKQWDSPDPQEITESVKAVQTQLAVFEERHQQFEKWGSQAHKPDHIWSLILMEEFGELVDDAIDSKDADALIEAVQMTAVSNAWAEAISERGIKRNNQDILEFPILSLFSKLGRMSKAMLENDLNTAYMFANAVSNTAAQLRDSIEQLQFLDIEIDPSKPKD